MRNCFVDVGLAPCELTYDSATYKVYTAHKRARKPQINPRLWKPEFCLPETASLAGAIEQSDGMQIITRLDAQDDLDADGDVEETEYGSDRRWMEMDELLQRRLRSRENFGSGVP